MENNDKQLDVYELQKTISDYKECFWIDFVESEFEGSTYLLPSENPMRYKSSGFYFNLFGQDCWLSSLTAADEGINIVAPSREQPIKANLIRTYTYDLRSIEDSFLDSETPKEYHVTDDGVTLLCYKRGVKEPVFAKCFFDHVDDGTVSRLTFRILLKLMEAGDGEFFFVLHNSVLTTDCNAKEIRTVNGCQVCNMYIHPYGYRYVHQDVEFDVSSLDTNSFDDNSQADFCCKFSAILPYDKQMVRIVCVNDNLDVVGESDYRSELIERQNDYENPWYSMNFSVKKRKIRRHTPYRIVVFVNNLPFLEYDVYLHLGKVLQMGKGDTAGHDYACRAAQLYVHNPIFRELGLSVSSAKPYLRSLYYFDDPYNDEIVTYDNSSVDYFC